MIQVKLSRIENQIEQLKLQPNIQIVLCQPQGISRNDIWIVWIHGRKNTIWEGGIYPIEINFPNQYPSLPPIISFQKDFQHVHVYQGGLICMPILQTQYWKPKSSMIYLLQRLQGLIHQQINKYSPANNAMYQLYKTDIQKYEQTIKEQAMKYKQKNISYFQKSCVHIDFL